MSHLPIQPIAKPQSLAPAILRETKAIRALIEETILPENGDGGAGGDPIQSILDVQDSILKALREVKASIEALHHRLDRSTRPALAGER